MESASAGPPAPPSEGAHPPTCPWRYAVCPYLGKHGLVYEPLDIDLSDGARGARSQLLQKLNSLLGRKESRLEDLYGFVDYRYAGTRCSKRHLAFTLKDFTSETNVLVYPSGKASRKRLRPQEGVVRTKIECNPAQCQVRTQLVSNKGMNTKDAKDAKDAKECATECATEPDSDREQQRLAKECREAMDPRGALPSFFWPLVARENLRNGVRDAKDVSLSADMLKIYASYIGAAVLPALAPAQPSGSVRRVSVLLSVHPRCVGKLECVSRELSAECDREDAAEPHSLLSGRRHLGGESVSQKDFGTDERVSTTLPSEIQEIFPSGKSHSTELEAKCDLSSPAAP